MIFGDYIPFLQLAFGVNILLGAWDRIYAHLETLQEESKKSDEALLTKVDAGSDEKDTLEGKRKKCEQVTNWFRLVGRRGGIFVAIIIAVAVFFIPRDQVMSGWGLTLIFASGFAIPILMWLMNHFGKRCHDNATALANDMARNAAQAEEAVQDGAQGAAADIDP